TALPPNVSRPHSRRFAPHSESIRALNLHPHQHGAALLLRTIFKYFANSRQHFLKISENRSSKSEALPSSVPGKSRLASVSAYGGFLETPPDVDGSF